MGKVYPRRVEFREYRLEHEDFLGLNYLVVLCQHSDLMEHLSS